jgi:hypothetical protein
VDENEVDDAEFLKCPCKECGNNIEYPASAAGTTIECPHCGEWTELASAPERRVQERTISLGKVLVVIWLLLIAGLGVWFFRFKHAHAPQTSPAAVTNLVAKPKPKVPIVQTNVVLISSNEAALAKVDSTPRPKSHDDLKVTFLELQKTPGSSLVYAVGTLLNDSDYQRFGVAIELNLTDENGRDLGKTKDYKDLIEPRQKWQFRALVPDPKTASAKISSIKEQE